MNLCVLSGAPPGVGDGVGDFAWRLAGQLATDHHVALMSPPGQPVSGSTPGVAFHPVSSDWGRQSLREVTGLLARLKPAAVLVQFVPQLYGWYGIKPGFTFLLLALRRRGYPIITVAHEFRAPFGPSPKLMILSTIHRILLPLIVSASRRVVLTTPFCLDLFRKRFRARQWDFHQIPVGCNVDRINVTEGERQGVRTELGIPDGALVMCTLRSTAGTADEWFPRVVTGLDGGPQPLWPLILGRAGESLRRGLSDSLPVHRRAIVTGAVSNEKLSRYVSMSDCYAVFYPDGASTRRASLMIGLGHGTATVSNVGALTDPLLAGSGGIHLLHDVTDGRDVRELRHLRDDACARKTLGRRGQELFDAQFSWPRIAARYMDVIEGALNS